MEKCLKNFFKVIFCISFLLIVHLTCAQTTATIADNFNTVTANQFLTAANAQLIAQPRNINYLENIVTNLSRLQNQAQHCVQNSTKDLANVNAQLQQLSGETKVLKTPPPEVHFLQDKRAKIITQLSECRLFILRSQDTINNYNVHLQKVATRRLFAAEPHIFDKTIQGAQSLLILPQHFDSQLFMDQSGLNSFTMGQFLAGLVLILISIPFGFKLKNFLKKKLVSKENETFLYQIKQAFLAVLSRYSVVLIVLLVLNILVTLLVFYTLSLNYLALICYALTIYALIYVFLIRLFFDPPYGVIAPSHFPKETAKSLAQRLNFLAILLLVAGISYIIFADQALPAAFFQFIRTIFITLVAISLISVVYIFGRIPKVLSQHPSLQLLLSLILAIVLFVIIVAEWLGYHGIANYLLLGTIFTSLLMAAAWLIQKILISAINMLTNDQYEWQQHLHAHLGIKKNQVITEVIWLKLIVYVVVACGFFVLLLRIWGLSKNIFNQLLNTLINGFKIAKITIVPPHILLAFLLFTVLILVTRWLRQKVTTYRSLDVAPGARDAFAAIVGYIGFALAAIIALLVAGVNFAGLAIIAGALSVGIGFGLQNIVNNFVSGIILLIERPIKLGDRIIVGGTEGFVKKISIRSTQLETAQRADVIVPNSELITGQVVNLMYRNLYSRISIPISVNFDSSPEDVKNILLTAAKNHPQVINDYPANEPKVTFLQISKDGLDFELSCLIADVNTGSNIKSDLYYAIEKAMKDANIKFAYPQRDVHLREER